METGIELRNAEAIVSWIQPIRLATCDIFEHYACLNRRSDAGGETIGRDMCIAHQSWLI